MPDEDAPDLDTPPRSEPSPVGDWEPVDEIDTGPVEEFAVADLDRLGDLTHPIRGRLLRRLRDPRTVAELATELGVPVTRLYHHVNRLDELGFIRVVATRRVAARTERRYQVVAKSYTVAKELLQSSDPTELAQALGSLFDAAKFDFQRTVEAGDHIDVDDIDRYSVISLGDLVLTPDRRVELLDRLRALLDDVRSDASNPDSGADPETMRMSLMIAAFPSSD